MRLLSTTPTETGNFIIEEFFGEPPPYAILSHTWHEMEVTFQDITTGVINKKGFKKVKDCCTFARAHGYGHAWIDTCCIDKTSSAELSESLNSMYRWYQEAEVCYAYLADVPLKPLAESRWFTRGWTLQELIAPSSVIFLDQEWNELGTKESLRDILSEITSIPTSILAGDDDVEVASVAQRMSWAARRETTRVEDRAYCLMGIFGINMPPIYGEGKNAFIRLQEEIMKVLDDHSIFAWRSESEEENHGGLLATSPDAFRECANIVPYNPFTTVDGPLTLLANPLQACCDTEINWKNANGINENGQALLTHASEKGHVDMLWLLLTRSDVRADGRDLSGHTPLSRAAQFGQEAIVKMLLARNDVEPGLGDKDGRSPLSYAAANGHYGVAKLLLQSGKVYADSKDTFGRTPLSWAAQNGHELLVKLLLEKGAEVDSKDRQRGRTPLSWAADKNDHDRVVALLLENGAFIESRDDYHKTPLSWAARQGRYAVAKLLLEKGANIETQDEGSWTPLLWAARNGRKSIVSLLLENGASIEAKDDQNQTPLVHAAVRGHEETVRLLLEKGADTESLDIYHETPLFQAVGKGHETIVRLLLEMGANIESRNNQQRTPLFLAIMEDHEAIVKLLLEKGADMMCQDNSRLTPLSLAMRKDHDEMANLLQDMGAQRYR
ncbi:hypothetical protein ETB97_001363 [Aspergillus alliaceus]|uniref:Heterokaryon incompatibility domain-containing protein n=1 Tax=Petromyces alliaceus TaxID=209559 RepID=A0A8H6A402_PETAA|nr:hypothetical protein ETB97_001363 [Aspergillus burnettii]